MNKKKTVFSTIMAVYTCLMYASCYAQPEKDPAVAQLPPQEIVAEQESLRVTESPWIKVVDFWPIDENTLTAIAQILIQTPIDTLSPFIGKNAMQYALVNERYEAALGLIVISSELSNIFSRMNQDKTKDAGPDQEEENNLSAIRQALIINPLAFSSSETTTLEYLFRSIEKNKRRTEFADHIKACKNTFNMIMMHLLQTLSTIAPAVIADEQSQISPEDRPAYEKMLASIRSELRTMLDTLDQEFANKIALMDQQLILAKRLKYDLSYGKNTNNMIDVERIQSFKDLFLSLLQQIKQARDHTERLASINGGGILLRMLNNLFASDLLGFSPIQLTLLNYWLMNFSQVVAFFAQQSNQTGSMTEGERITNTGTPNNKPLCKPCTLQKD